MAVTILTRERLGPTTWRLTWESDLGGTPTYYIYIDGLLADTTTRDWKQFEFSEGEEVQIEILDADTTPTVAYPSRFYMTWRPVTDAAKYRVEQYVDAAWTTLRTIFDNGETWFTYTTDVLDDVTSHQFRVVPVGTNGVDGFPRSWTVFMVRRPPTPSVTYTYDDVTAKVTIAAA